MAEAPNMATITASIERSLQNFTLTNNNFFNQSSSSSSSSCNSTGGGGGIRPLPGSDSPENLHLSNDNNSSSIELHSQVPLPYYWEQCLDLKTGEVYYINWRTGMKSKEDPRTINNNQDNINCGFYNSEDDSSYDSDHESSSESSPSPSSSRVQQQQCQYNATATAAAAESNQRAQVLVAAGCKSCLMYFMVPKQAEDCPKCFGQLLHFDRSGNGSS